MFGPFRPTLRQVFGLSLFGLLLGLALLFYLVFSGSQWTILQSSERYRELASEEVEELVTTYLNEAPMAVDQFEKQIRNGLINPQKPDSVETGLFSLLIANENLSEATFTYADGQGFDDNGDLETVPTTRGQIAVFRSLDGSFTSRRTWFNGTRFVSASSPLARGNSVGRTNASTVATGTDPTAHMTFQTPASKLFYGHLIPTDLHWSQLDESLPEAQRRVEVSVLKTIENSQGHFAGVLRIGLMKTQIDGSVQLHITGAHEADPHLIFLCDKQGRLITGFGNRTHAIESNGDLRIDPRSAPLAVETALREPVLQTVNAGQPVAASSFYLGSRVYLCTFRYLPMTQDWIVGIVVPQAFYLGRLTEITEVVLGASLGLMLAIILIGSLIVQSITRAQSLIIGETTRMNSFDFLAAQDRSYFRDVQEVLASLERAKTAMRSMSKYVPIDLVRRLYQKGEEPILGGKSKELSILFADVKGFTSFAETAPPDELARLLGLYLEAIATVVQSEKGTIDKYIGDAVMAFWNAPEPVADHEAQACRAVLRCNNALRKLYNSGAWGSTPRFETRFGLHRCTASVGHFGAPDRFNYTAIGDGINLASRLESLNKQYGTTVIVSEAIHAVVQNRFRFRLLDRVAVKGKVEGSQFMSCSGIAPTRRSTLMSSKPMSRHSLFTSKAISKQPWPVSSGTRGIVPARSWLSAAATSSCTLQLYRGTAFTLSLPNSFAELFIRVSFLI